MATWKEFEAELDRWHRAGETATLWWRDDDAGIVHPALERLVALGETHAIPIYFAAIPDRLETDAIKALKSARYTQIMQHGFAHIDHAPKGEGSWELGDHRPNEQTLGELKQGRLLLADAFADKFLPVQVPPWTRISQTIAAALNDVGFAALSLEGRRSASPFAPAIPVINPHCDPIKWKKNASFKGAERALDDFVDHLRFRRETGGDKHEPTGLCTHHLDHKDDLWSFLEEFANRTSAHPAVNWTLVDQWIA